MKLSSIGISLSNIEKNDSQFDALPKGTYDVVIDSIEQRTTRAGTGEFLSIAMTVMGPTHVNRKLWANANIVNPNPTAQNIGLGMVAQLFSALGLGDDADTDECIGGLLKANVAIDKNDSTRNQVNGFAPSATQAPVAKVAQAPAVNKAPATQPWMNKK